MFEVTSQELAKNDRVCQALSMQVTSLAQQVESLNRTVRRLSN
ncbi:MULTISPECIES: MbeD/MobD family mobilization/exclusion protein [Enterobacterales]